MSLRILVTGSRDFPLPLLVGLALAQVGRAHLADGRQVVVVHGGCPHGYRDDGSRRYSVDMLAQEWAEMHSAAVRAEVYPAEWDRYGRSAGFRRNLAMVALGADLTLAFIANASKGATHCAEAAERAGIPVLRLRVDGPVGVLAPVVGTADSQPGGAHG